ncbi:hypothetical protein FIV31_01300 [Coxiella endosymbiont of Ornithodoros amblus]|nr:hypothetical protein [Coxiella endosymbiont of Ornithodoros amblus]
MCGCADKLYSYVGFSIVDNRRHKITYLKCSGINLEALRHSLHYGVPDNKHTDPPYELSFIVGGESNTSIFLCLIRNKKWIIVKERIIAKATMA